MISSISPTVISESYRLSQSGMHQGMVVALQSEFDGLRLKTPGVILEISRQALIASLKVDRIREQQQIQPVSSLYNSRGLLAII